MAAGEPAAPVAGAAPEARRPLGNAFWAFWSAVLAANVADGLVLVALPWAASRLTDSELAVSAVATAGRLPWLLVVLPVGVVVDRVRRLRLMSTAALVRAVLLVSLGVLLAADQATVLAVAVFAFLLGTTEVLFDTASESTVPSLVDAARLPRANGHIRSAEVVSNDFVGRPLGGLAVKLGLAAPFFVSGVMTVAASGAVVALGRRRPDVPVRGDSTRANVREDLREGVSFVWREPVLRYLAALAAALSALYATMLGIQVLFVQRVLGVGALGFAVLLSVASLGALAGGQLVGRLVDRVGRAAALRGALAVMGACFLAVGLASNAVVVGALYVVASAAVIVSNVVTVSVRQVATPDHMLGRVSATARLLSWGLSAVGMLLGGLEVSVAEHWLGEADALRVPFLVAGAGFLVILAISSRRLGDLIGER